MNAYRKMGVKKFIIVFLALVAIVAVSFIWGCGGDDNATTTVATDVDADGYTVEQGDCNDNDASIYPGAEEVTDDGIDQDCNSLDAVTLRVDKFGEGVILSNDYNIDCGDDCSEIYQEGSSVTLIATPESDYEFFAWAGCDSVSGDECSVTLTSGRTVFPSFSTSTIEYNPETKILENTTMQNLIEQSGSIYYFASSDPTISSLEVGDIIISSYGGGILRKVISITDMQDGRTAIDTTDATLEDAIEDGTIIVSQQLNNVNLTSSQALQGKISGVRLLDQASVSETFPYEIDEYIDTVHISGNMSLSYLVVFGLEYKRLHLGVKEVSANLIVTNENRLLIEGDTGASINQRILIDVVSFTIPAQIPVMVNCKIYLGVNGQIEANIRSSAVMDISQTAGVHYTSNSGWSTSSSFEKAFSYSPPEVSASASIKGYVNPEVEFMLIGIAGPYFGGEGYVRAQATLENMNSIPWSLYSGLSAYAGAKVEIIGWTLAELPQRTLYQREWLLSSGTINLTYDVFYRDADGDSYGDPYVSQTATSIPSGYVTNSLDCDDTQGSGASIFPGATETCGDGIRQDCNLRYADEGCPDDTDPDPNASQSDLIIQNLTVSPSSGLAGSSTAVSFNIYNGGNGTANDSITRIRINTSSNNVNSGDTILLEVGIPEIASHGSYNVSRSVTIPGNLSSGNYYIWIILDVNNDANQSDDNNDKGNTTFLVIPDNSNDTDPPSAPTGLTATAVSTSQIDLSWTAPADSDVAGYNVKYNGNTIKSVTGTSTFISSLTASTNYCYTVTAYDTSNNESNPSSQACDTTYDTPSIDTILPDTSITSGPSGTITNSNSVTFAFIGSDDTTTTSNLLYSYMLQGYDTSYSNYTSSTSKSYSSLPNSSYTFYVKAKDAAGNEDPTPASQAFTINYTTSDTTQPAVSVSSPSNNSTSTTSSITIYGTATDSGGSGLNRVVITNTTNNATVQVNASGNSYDFSVSGITLTAGQNTITVKSYDNAENFTDPPVTIYVTYTPADTTPPTVPANVTATATSSTSISLSWTASTDAVGVTGYKVYKEGTYLKSVTTGTSTTDTGLLASTQYCYTVLAYDAAGNPSEQSSPSSCATTTSNQPTGTIRVPQDYSTIQAAINAASNGCTIMVAAGTYTEKINFNGKAIIVQSVSGASVTIINGNASGHVVTFGSGETLNSILDGFSITNGKANSGGGIYCSSSSSPVITNCTISGNTAGSTSVSGNGGGIYCNSSSPTITNCTISNNTVITSITFYKYLDI